MAKGSSKHHRNFRRESSSRNAQSRVEFLKQVLTFFNVFFLLAGLGVLAVGVWTIVDKYHFASILVSTNYAVAAYLLIGAGCLVTVSSVIGFVAIYRLKKGLLVLFPVFRWWWARKTWKELRLVLIFPFAFSPLAAVVQSEETFWNIVPENGQTMKKYIFLLLLIFLVEVAAGVLAYLYAKEMKSDLEHRLRDIVEKEYGQQSSVTMTNSMDSLQAGLGCCGSLLFSDWDRSIWSTGVAVEKRRIANYVPVPDSCCKNATEGCGARSHPSNIYYDGCAESFAAFLRDHLYIIGGVGIGVCAIQLFGAIISCCLVSKIKKTKETTSSLRYDYTRAG